VAGHGRDQVLQPAGQATRRDIVVGGGLDVGDTGSPQPFELGDQARPVASSDRAGRREQTVEF
jgi:hypothetical protein